MKKELYIFLGIFLFLSIGMHLKEWTAYPLKHTLALPNSGAYGMGFMHPLIFTFVVYIFFVLIRSIYRGIKKLVIK